MNRTVSGAAPVVGEAVPEAWTCFTVMVRVDVCDAPPALLTVRLAL
jgi:hypothetical protein